MHAGLSARERNQLKRKLKQQAAAAAAGPSQAKRTKADVATATTVRPASASLHALPPHFCHAWQKAAGILAGVSQGDAAEALAAAAAEDDDAWRDITRGAWPLQRLAEQLCLDAVHACWESRHGAAVALREVLRSHAACAAVRAPLASEQPSGAHALQAIH